MGAFSVLPFFLLVVWAGIEQAENEKEEKRRLKDAKIKQHKSETKHTRIY